MACYIDDEAGCSDDDTEERMHDSQESLQEVDVQHHRRPAILRPLPSRKRVFT